MCNGWISLTLVKFQSLNYMCNEGIISRISLYAGSGELPLSRDDVMNLTNDLNIPAKNNMAPPLPHFCFYVPDL